MKKIIVVLVVLFVTSISFSAEIEVMDSFWKEQVDSTVEWGQWMDSIKPYIENIAEESKKNITDAAQDIINLSIEEVSQKFDSAYLNQYEALKNITPPSELHQYHQKTLQYFDELAKGYEYVVQNQELINGFVLEVTKEIEKVFKENGVPQAIISEFLKNPLSK